MNKLFTLQVILQIMILLDEEGVDEELIDLLEVPIAKILLEKYNIEYENFIKAIQE